MRESRDFGQRSKTRTSNEVRKKVFLIFEGNETEPLYFAALRDERVNLGISPLIDFIQIMKGRYENWSNPKKLLERLCLHLSDAATYDSLVEAMVETLYTSEYLKQRGHLIAEFESLVGEFISSKLQKSKNDIVENMEDAVAVILEHFKESWPEVCRLVLDNWETAIKEQEITYDKEIDLLCLVVDRDPGSFTGKQFDAVYDTCDKHGFRLLVSNPCFEFWLLLHFDMVNNLDRRQLQENQKVAGSRNSIRFVEHALKKCLGKYSKRRYDVKLLMGLIDTAIMNEKNFCESLPELKTQLGSNIGCFIASLKDIGLKD